MHHELYRHADAYDIAFDYRDVVWEVDFLARVHAEHSTRPLLRAIELCCGPGWHAVDFARRGWKAAALDLSPEMVAHVHRMAERRGLRLLGLVDDMRSFTAPHRFDLAVNLLTSVAYLQTDDDLGRHFAAVAKNLDDGGLYVVEANHPKDFFCGLAFQESAWTMVRDGVSVETSWICEPPVISWVDQTYRVKARYRIDDHGTKSEFVDEATLRMHLPRDLTAAATAAGFRHVASYGNWEGAPFDDSDASWRNLAVYRKGG